VQSRTTGRTGREHVNAHRGPYPYRTGVDEVLRRARARLTRLTAAEAGRLLAAGRIVLVDTRPLGQRQADGEIPGAVVVDRNVLEWRLDPASPSRLPIARYDLPVVVLCNQGYSSSLAAAGLKDLGLTRATDVVGGFEAWRAAGLPVTAPAPSAATDG
jgi:rhodanese-related sulfurtransferase